MAMTEEQYKKVLGRMVKENLIIGALILCGIPYYDSCRDEYMMHVYGNVWVDCADYDQAILFV